jgi:hypothetical protein
MSTFDRALHKYDRAKFEQMTTDDWITLVEGLGAKHDALAEELAFTRGEMEHLQAELEACDHGA